MGRIDSMSKRMLFRREVRSRETDSLSKELGKLQKRQRFLWDHGHDSDLAEYEDNQEKILIISAEIRSRKSREGGIHCRFNQGVKNR